MTTSGGQIYELIYDPNTLSPQLVQDLSYVKEVLDDLLISGPSNTLFTATITEDSTLIGENTLGWAGGGAIGINPDNVNSIMKLNNVSMSVNRAVLIHEIFHIFGIGSGNTWWNNAWQTESTNGSIFFFYGGPNGVQKYKDVLYYQGGHSIDHINSMGDYLPIEDDGGLGTMYSHIEESTYPYPAETISYNNVIYPMVPQEIMTGWLNASNFITKMSMGILEDIGFSINYSSSYIWDGSMYTFPEPESLVNTSQEPSYNIPDAIAIDISLIENSSIIFDFNTSVFNIENNYLRLIINNLPNNGLLKDPSNNNNILTGNDLPYELSGSSIEYLPNTNYIGIDNFYYYIGNNNIYTYVLDIEDSSLTIAPVNITIIPSYNFILENWLQGYNLNNNLTRIIDISFNADLGQYIITPDINNNNVEFNQKNNSSYSGSGIDSQNYSNTFLKYSNYSDKVNGCIQLSTDVYNSSSDSNWSIEYPIINISNNNNLINEALFLTKVEFNNISNSAIENFYYEIYSNDSWKSFYSINNIRNITNNSNYAIIDICQNIANYINFNDKNIQIRVRVSGFQEKDYLTLGSYLILYRYTENNNVINTPPIANNISISLIEDTSKVIDLSASDIDPQHSINDPSFLYIIDSLTISGSLIDPSDNNNINSIPYILKTKHVKYIPYSNYNGLDSFYYYVQDPSGERSSSAEIILNIIPLNDPPSGQVTISGSFIQNSILTAITLDISDQDGLTTPDFSYQWYRDGEIIPGATDVSYLLQQSDVDKQINVKVWFTDNYGTREDMSSNNTVFVTNINDLPSGQVTISGSFIQNSILTAITLDISDQDGLTTPDFSYQWYRDGEIIPGATDVSYLLQQSDVDKQINVKVWFTDNYGTREDMSSNNTVFVTNINDLPSGQVTISGSFIQNSILTAITSDISDQDGLTTPDFSYQWYRDGEIIPGATDVSYLLQQSDIDKQINVKVWFTDNYGTREDISSNNTVFVTNINDLPSGQVTISGSLIQNSILTAITSDISDQDGLITPDFSYQWYRDGEIIPGATDVSYVLQQSDVDKQINVKVWFTDNYGTREDMSSNNTLVVTNVNDPPSGQVTISGNFIQNSIITAITSDISDQDGLTTPDFSYQWYRDGEIIPGATDVSYLLQQSDVDKQINVKVWFTDNHGTREDMSSNNTVVVTNVNDPPSGQVTISGNLIQNSIITAITSDISDQDGLTTPDFSYQWYRDGEIIPGATDVSYLLQQSDVDKQINVKVWFTDNYGTREDMSSNNTVVVTNVNDPPSGQVTINGNFIQNSIITAITSDISDQDGLTTPDFSYQWYRDGEIIPGATDVSYLLQQSDVDKQINVKVWFTDNHGTREDMSSNNTVVVTNINDLPSGQVTISGSLIQNRIITAITSDISDQDGLTTPDFSYQWYRDGEIIPGATDVAYLLQQSDVDKQINVKVWFTDNYGTREDMSSNNTVVVTNINDLPSGQVTISGSLIQNSIITAITSDISDQDGLTTPDFSYQWYRDGEIIPGATDVFYLLQQSDVDKQINVKVWFTDNYGTREDMCSNNTVFVTNINDLPSGQVTISGSLIQNSIITAITSDISDQDGLTTPDFSYQWYRDGEIIPGATDVSYLLQQSDVDKQINVKVWFTDNYGTREDMSSNNTVFVTNINDPPSGQVTISGSLIQNSIITAITSDISDQDGLTTPDFSYQWYRDGEIIPGATDVSYLLQQSDVDKQINVKVWFTDNYGTREDMCSNNTVFVTNINDLPSGQVTISGSFIQNSILTAITSDISDQDGFTTPDFSYQWYRDGEIIPGATDVSYLLQQSDVDKQINVKVWFTDNYGTREDMSSNNTVFVTNINNTSEESVVGTYLCRKNNNYNLIQRFRVRHRKYN